MNLQIWDGPLKCILRIFSMDSDVWLCLEPTLPVFWKCTLGEKQEI